MTAQTPQTSNGTTRPAASSHSDRIRSALRQNMWLTLVGVAVGGLLAALYLYLAPEIYMATAVIQVGPDPLQELDLPEDLRTVTAGKGPEARQEIQRMLLSRPLLERVVETNALARDARFLPAGQKGTAGTSSLAARLAGMVSVESPANDTRVKVTVAHPSRELSVELANSLVNELVRETAQSRAARLTQYTNTLLQDIRSAEQRLAPTREEAMRLKARHDGISLELRDLMSKVPEAKAQRIRAETDERALELSGTNAEVLLTLPFIAGDAKVIAARTALAEKEEAFETVQLTYRWKHPTYVAAEREVTNRRQLLSDAVRAAAESRRASSTTAKADEAALQERVEKLSREAENISQNLSERTNSIAAAEATLQRFHTKMQAVHDAALKRNLLGNLIGVDQEAVVPPRPSWPDPLKVLALGLLVGLLLGLSVSLAIGLADTSLKSVEETERLLGLSVLSAVPPVPAKQPKPGPLGPEDEAHFAVAEAFRSLRASVSVIAKEKELKSFLFTSATPKEGKTLCALGFAVSLAQQGLRTLLIECDLRRPMAAVALSGIKQDARGVSDYLDAQPASSTFQPAEPKPRSEGGLSFAELRRKQHAVAEAAATAPSRAAPRPVISSVTLDDILQKTEIDGLSFISAGTRVPNPAELLARQGLSKFLGDALRRFDRIVIDAAPLLGISDTLLLVNQVQATCLVVRAHQTQRRAVMRTVEMLRRTDAFLLGVILNDFSAAKSERYGEYYHYYGRETKQPGEPRTP